LHNLSDSAEQALIAELQAEKFFAAVDCATGKITELEPVDVEKNIARLRLSLSPLQTVIIASSPVKIGSAPPANEFNPFVLPLRSYRIVFKEQWGFEPLSLNALPLSNWSLRMGMSKESGQISHFYETTFEVKNNPDACALILNGMGNAGVPFQNYEITFNGMRIDNEPPSFDADNAALESGIAEMLGKDAPRFDIKKKLAKGLNRISIRTTGSAVSPQTLVYPPVIIGDFAIAKGPHGWALDKPVEPIVGHDSWVKHGYPYLSGRARYTQSFEVPNEYDKLILRFSRVSGSVYVKVNGEDAGALHWQPMELDITKLCNSMRNELAVEVVNTMDNVLRMSGRPSGLTGEVYVDVYKM
jgi:hypothetical protein